MLTNILFDQYLEDFIKTNLHQPIFVSAPYLTYGEITVQSLFVLLTNINWCSEDVFCDFGSGYGKVLWHVWRHAHIKQVIGIEYFTQRHQIAQALYEHLLTKTALIPSKKINIIIQKDDFLINKLGREATIIYAASTCFGPQLMSQLSAYVDKLTKLRLILSFRPLCGLRNFILVKRLHIECSWDSAFCFMYKRI